VRQNNARIFLCNVQKNENRLQCYVTAHEWQYYFTY